MARPFLVGLVGTGVGPSLTPPLHMREARAHGLDYVYRTLDLDVLGVSPSPEALGELLGWARRLGYDALNVTHPCKQRVVGLVDRLDPAAERLGAVNTVLFAEDGTTTGHNTDTTGFATALATGLPGAATGEVVQLGAGGAGSAVADALLAGGTERLVIVDLDADRSEALARDLARSHPDARVEAGVPDKLPALLPHADGLVHCTPVGMAAHPGVPLDVSLLRPGLWVADIVYRPLRTALLDAAESAGCRTLHGGHMAVHQAVDALRLITGIAPDPARMLAHLRELTDPEPPAR